MSRRYLTEEPFYPIYAALDSAALLALLPELDRWEERFAGELRQISDTDAKWPEHDAATAEPLNEAKAAWHARMQEETDPALIQGIKGLLASIDAAKASLAATSARHFESSWAHSQEVLVTLDDLMRRRRVAVKILSDRGVLPADLAGD